MADDIDIEEHDVLDNPRIKNIFPDITSIKIEAPDYDEEVLDYEEDNLDSNHDTDPKRIDDEYEDAPPLMYQNKIILGTKPCSSPELQYDLVPKLLKTSLVLENWGLILNSSPCYCKTCKILFPTENALDSHKMTAHSFLIAVGKNKAVKSTAKSSVTNRFAFEKSLNEGEILCNHCNIMFPDEIALLKHTYELFPTKLECDNCDLIFDTEAALVSHKLTHSVECYLCEVCSCHFIDEKKYIKHVKIRHQIEAKPELVTTDYKCAFCNATFRGNKHYNGHIAYRHSELYFRIGTKSIIDKSGPSNFKPSHLDRVRKSTSQNDKGDASEDVGMKPSRPDVIRRAIPKSTLFRCNKCQIHFVFCSVAIEHEKRCVLKKGDWKCKQCRRCFKQVDRISHLQQHKLTDRFKVVKVRGNILNKVLCKCTSCNVCFDEKTLLKYHSEGCTGSNYVICEICHCRIDENALEHHKKMHKILGNDSFLNVDTVCVEQIQTNNLKSLQENVKTLSTKTINIELKRCNKKEKFYYYCTNCKCYMKVSKLPDRHNMGRCNTNLMKCLCKSCGLRFSQKGYLSHKREHKQFPNLRLRDLTFEDTQTGEKIEPPFPIFKKCKKCLVSYFSEIALRNHSCNGEEAKMCKYCSEKFSDLAHKLHVPFHEYSLENCYDLSPEVDKMPQIIKTYESLKTIWNILFLCETCDVVTDSYDTVVEHCQDHFGNMESYNVTINHCVNCDLKFIGHCYEKHKKLHSANTISKSTFKILPCKYEDLLSESWNDMFDSLSKNQVDLIVNKSKYKYVRCVRFEVLRDGPVNFTLYQCDMCSAIVDWNMVSSHTHSLQCMDAPKYSCLECPLIFSCHNSLLAHGYMHSTCSVDDKRMRILTFKCKNHDYINNSIRSKINPESLKFIRCNICGKLINKSKYKKHVYNHKYTQKTDHRQTDSKGPKLLVRSKYKKIETPSHNFYKCRNCDICVVKPGNRTKHFCDSKSCRKQCPKCLLIFRASHYRKHQLYHEKYKLKKNNINVVYFKNENTQPKYGKIILYQCTSCDLASHSPVVVKKHLCVTENYQKVCDLCNMTFHVTNFNLHYNIHKERQFSEKDLFIVKFMKGEILGETTKIPKTVKSSLIVKSNDLSELKNKEFLKNLHCRIFKCLNCKILFVTPSALLSHQNECNHDSKGVKCKTCGLVFHSKQIFIHEKRAKCFSRAEILGCVTTTSVGLTYNDKKSLYRCIKCDMWFLSFRAVYNHFLNNHVFKVKNSKCEICDINLTPFGYKNHTYLHSREKLTLSDFISFEVSEITLNNARKDLPNKKCIIPKPVEEPEEDKLEVNESIKADIVNQSFEQRNTPELVQKKPLKRKLPNVAATPNKNIKIEVEISENEQISPGPIRNDNIIVYNCHICDLNFLNKKSLSSHCVRGNHDEKKVECPKCGLKFTRHSLKRHIRTHTDNPDTSSDIKIKSEPEEYEGTNMCSLTIEPDTQSNTSSTSNSNRLYKCSACDVYYLHRDACSDHVTNHIYLDQTEYIACKICDLQFLCEYLGTHMKRHREKSFSIDDLIVEEYQIVDGRIKIDSYSAADRIKSKAVSTTTHFESEESTVDSTQFVVSKSFCIDKHKVTNENDMSSTSEVNKTL